MRVARRLRSLWFALGLCAAAAGCAGCQIGPPALEIRAARAAAPLLELDPDACWTEQFNALVELGPSAVDYLVHRPEMRATAAPDDLRVLVTCSLVRLLSRPGRGPRLSASALETGFDLLHFDLKVDGQPLGPPLVCGRPPRRWHELYPAAFNHALAARIDVEGDRRRVCEWWVTARDSSAETLLGRPLRPMTDNLFRVLSRRAADVWTYPFEDDVVRCSSGPPELLALSSQDYNLVRAACIWLGSRPDEAVRGRLIDVLAGPSPAAAYNARFALMYCADARIRELARRYHGGVESAPAPAPGRRSL